MKLKDRFGFFTWYQVRPYSPFIEIHFPKYITGHRGIEILVGDRGFEFMYKF